MSKNNPADIITIYTDASLCPKTGAAGWACWIKYRGATLEASGQFEELIFTSMEAELKAIVNGVCMARNNYALPADVIFCVVTDCRQAIEIAEGNTPDTKKGRKNQPALWACYDDLVALVPNMSKFYVKWVKAHSNKDGRRSYVNNLVDALAKKQMRVRRDFLQIPVKSVQSVSTKTEDFDVPF